MVDGIPHHPVSWSRQQSQLAWGETCGPGQGSLAVPAPVLTHLAFFQFAYGAEVRRRDSGGSGQAGEGKDTHAFLVTGLDRCVCYSAQV